MPDDADLTNIKVIGALGGWSNTFRFMNLEAMLLLTAETSGIPGGSRMGGMGSDEAVNVGFGVFAWVMGRKAALLLRKPGRLWL
jgi:hypothetical protein